MIVNCRLSNHFRLNPRNRFRPRQLSTSLQVGAEAPSPCYYHQCAYESSALLQVEHHHISTGSFDRPVRPRRLHDQPRVNHL